MYFEARVKKFVADFVLKCKVLFEEDPLIWILKFIITINKLALNS